MNDVAMATEAERTHACHGDAEQQEVEGEQRAAAQEEALRRPGAQEVTEYADEMMRRIKFDPGTYYANSAVDGAKEEGYGITIPVREDTYMRVLCTATSRAPDKACWGDLPVHLYAAICILHDAMRTGEKLFESILAPLLDLYSGGQTAVVDQYLNRVLGRMSIRRIAKNRESERPSPSPHHTTTHLDLTRAYSHGLVPACKHTCIHTYCVLTT